MAMELATTSCTKGMPSSSASTLPPEPQMAARQGSSGSAWARASSTVLRQAAWLAP